MHIKDQEVIIINLSGRGDKDLETYIKHFKDAE
jgi:tryptophan synthase beta chain